jgi:Tfp pilus assembly protein PilF
MAIALAMAGCASPPPAGPGVAALMDRPAERALIDGIRAYDDGQYEASEQALRRALGRGLAHDRDRATAHKLIAFITCSSRRPVECEAAFREARRADPAFTLSRSEAGHPLWGPVWRRVAP